MAQYVLHFPTRQCYNLFNKSFVHNMHQSPSLLAIVRGIFGVAIVAYFFLSLRLRSQCANKATIQPLITVVVM